jgi:hypothetical protein
MGNLGIDDYLILLAVGCLIGDLVIQQHMWNLGLGDMSTVTPGNFKGIMQMIIPGSTLYVSSPSNSLWSSSTRALQRLDLVWSLSTTSHLLD